MLSLVLNTTASSEITFNVITEDDSARGGLSYGTLCTLSPPLSLSPPPSLLSFPSTISLHNTSVSALAPGDYEPINSTISIPAGGTESIISLLVKADNITEDPESFTLRLLNPSDGVSLGDSMATVNIVDLDGN